MIFILLFWFWFCFYRGAYQIPSAWRRRVLPYETASNSQVTRTKIDDLLTERHRRFSPLQLLLRRSADQHSWTAQLQALLPDPLSRDCQVTDLRGPVIVVTCSNAASATRLRFMKPDLLIELQQLADFKRTSDIHIKVSAT